MMRRHNSIVKHSFSGYVDGYKHGGYVDGYVVHIFK